MKMLKLFQVLLIPLFIISVQNSFAQNEWAPIGAKWYYSHIPGLGNELTIIESIGDTVIDLQNCRILRFFRVEEKMSMTNYYYWDTVFSPNEYFYSTENEIYHFDRFLNTFYKLYDFAVEENDTILVRDTTYIGCVFPDYYCSTFSYVVDSITQQHIANDSLRIFHSHPTYQANWSFSSPFFNDNYPIIEKIGSVKFLFGSLNTVSLEGDISCLRCYIDNNLEYRTSFWIDSLPCSFLRELNSSNINKTKENPSDILLYPNPVHDKLHIKTPYHNMKNISVFSIYGERVLIDIDGDDNLIQINFKHLKPGVYVIKIVIEERLYNYLLIKEY